MRLARGLLPTICSVEEEEGAKDTWGMKSWTR